MTFGLLRTSAATRFARTTIVRLALASALASSSLALSTGFAVAQSYSFSSVVIEGNERVDGGTILSYAGIGKGQAVSAGQLNDAYQRVVNSGLFETVEFVPQGSTLVIRVAEFPTINRISIEGNKRIKDEKLLEFLRSQPRLIYSPSLAEEDATTIVGAYEAQGRYAATVDPKIIRRSNNRVDLVFEVTEGKPTEIERLSFTGNRDFTERRLRGVLETKQAGLLRQFIRRDTYDEGRLELDKQLLRDFYLSRGYIDFEILSASAEVARERDATFVTFDVREGESFRIGKVTTVSEIAGADAAIYGKEVRVKEGQTYSPADIDNTVTRLETLALRQGLQFVRVEPRLTRNDRDQTLDIEFAVVKGERIFVERIDIEGNATTLDRVIRTQFRTSEGDAFNPREIKEAAERIRALGYFANADVQARPGSTPESVIVDVNVEEQNTGSLSFGATYGADSGVGLTISYQENNFLGRGQQLRFDLNTGKDSRNFFFSFGEPNFLGRPNLTGRLSAGYKTTENASALYSTEVITFSPSLEFPVSESGRLAVRYTLNSTDIFNYSGDSALLLADEALGRTTSSAVGFTYSWDTRRAGLDPNTRVSFRVGADFAGLGGDSQFIKTTATATAERKILNEEVTVRAVVEGGAITMMNGNTRITDRFVLSSSQFRGFRLNGIGPRDLAATDDDALGGNYYAVARLEAEFPLGLPEEYGIKGGAFVDAGSLWGLDNPGTVDDSMNMRASAGLSLFWKTPLGPLRFNFSRALKKEDYDEELNFDLTVSTSF
jgi:outer membrane protein insertion porin family